MTDPVERRRCLVGQDAPDVPQRGLDGICIRERLPECAMQVAERREPARIVERVEQVAEARAVAAEVLLHRINGAETGLGSAEGGGVEYDDLPFMRWRKWCCCAWFIGVMFRRGEMQGRWQGPFGWLRSWSWVLVTRTLVVHRDDEEEIYWVHDFFCSWAVPPPRVPCRKTALCGHPGA